ncbi:MAG: hypothetical protein H5T46_00665 [Archaeoglobi archaeon]|nr:hypothetical protein [Candidatus Mnemosynella sp.]MBC7114853.1 hypothetical protein [Candidatus Mnemosynella bozhongmuii]
MNWKGILLAVLIISSLLTLSSAQQSTISVVSYSISPEVLMPGDSGILQITLRNTGSTPLKITGASLYGGVLKSGYVNYQHIGWIGAQETITLSFPVRAGEVSDGVYYPQIVISVEGGESFVFPIPVKVDSSPLELHLSDISSSAPFSIVRNELTELSLELVNPRDNTIESITIIPEIQNAEVLPERVFVGALDGHSSETISFRMRAGESFSEESLKFRVHYRNGENEHEILFEFPVKVLSSSSSLKLIPVETKITGSPSEEISIELDVANSLNSEVSSVTVIALSEKLSPREYYIGKMNPDDVFTAGFRVRGNEINGSESFRFIARYVENGIQKETSPVEVTVTIRAEGTSTSPLLYAAPLLAILILAFYLRRRK